MKIGKDEIQVNCNYCGKMDKKHINNINAVVDTRIIVVGIFLGLVATVVLWNYFGAIASISFVIPMLFWISENKMLTGFNKYTIRRK
ncbi:hypothetical protein LV716_07105 [Flagellimonas sp. HMM57]|uniref:hypothetical protein n=1 Tax=unclassified Flagellimonas TaxID=2644544 RepID=UPI001F0A5DF4|nr:MULTISPECIES: hypothetical protein [unclassified Flagellimonas]UII77529.1 hypothetical protein LV716_07105 [Flagellimonas sp. HMM57]